jgi:hypothetical protein
MTATLGPPRPNNLNQYRTRDASGLVSGARVVDNNNE